ncbi:MAG: 2-phospho-L-lactate transferase [Novosphingobium sp.]
MRVAVLTGGVGGAKFVLGLSHCAEITALTAVVNTGDDFRHLGLPVSPDIDTLLYTLSGRANVAQGWGREGESWSFLAALASLGGPDWFRLGDGDLALHVLRGARLAAGEPLSAITAEFARAWGIAARVLPMTDDPVATWLDTDEGPLPFQDYFVARRCEPVVRRVRFEGAASARPGPGVIAAIEAAEAVFVAPSNPFLSVDPILSVPGIADALRAAGAPIVAISPLVGGTAVKGPTAKLMDELGLAADNEAIAAHYAGLLTGLLHDVSDHPPAALPARAAATLMTTLDDKLRVARAALAFAADLAR